MRKTRDKKVLFLRSNPVAPDPRVEKEAAVLAEAGYTVDIFCWDRDSDHAVTVSEKTVGKHTCNVYRFGVKASFGSGFKNNLRSFLRFQKGLAGFIIRKGSTYRVIHACDLDTSMVGYFCAKARGAKVVYDVFDYYADAFAIPAKLRKLVIGIDTYIINHADGVILCSEQRRKQIGKAAPKRIAYIHNTPDRAECPALPSKANGRARIVYVGILSDGRLIPELLQIVSTHDDYELHIAGFGPLEELVHTYSARCDNIIYYGKVEYDRAITLEQNADIMIAAYDPAIANHKYAAPNKFYEALMLGKPIIMCEGTGFADLVKEYGIGAAVAYSETGLLQGLEEVRAMLDEYQEKSAFEKTLFREKYSWAEMATRLRALYEEIEKA